MIVTAGTPATLAVKKATTSIPLVMVAVADPVGDGIVASLARPGGNITGVTSIALDLEGKRFGLLRDLLPHAANARPRRADWDQPQTPGGRYAPRGVSLP
jgi:putative ABC transport system substrate-binding protein